MRLMLLILLIISPLFCHPCSCPKTFNLDMVIAATENVELALITSAKIEGNQVVVELSNIDVVKGVKVAKFFTPLQSSACGMSVIVGREYWLFIDKKSAVVKCNGSVLLGTVESIEMSRKYIQLIQMRQTQR